MATEILEHASIVRPAGSWAGAADDRVALTYDERYRRRVVLTCLSGRKVLLDQWWVATVPGIAIFVVSLGFNLLGDGLRDVLDPKSGGKG